MEYLFRIFEERIGEKIMIRRSLSGNMNEIVFEPVEPFYGGVISTFDIISDFTKQYDTNVRKNL